MPEEVDLYNAAYQHYGLEVYRQIRLETYGEDLGQTSWVDSAESEEIPRLLELTPQSRVLEVGCGSGRYALGIAKRIGCKIIGVDMNPHGVHTANELACSEHLNGLASFEECDVSEKLPFDSEAFDAVFANDVLCHVRGRAELLAELCRVLRPNGRLLFSDALVVAGLVSSDEIATRASIGYYLFNPPGVNEQLMQAAGFQVADVQDTTERAARIAHRWHAAREKRRQEVLDLEGASNFEGLQRFLSCVYQVMNERRLLRFVYLAHTAA